MERFKTLVAMLESQDPNSVAFEYLEEGRPKSKTYGEFLKDISEYRIPNGPVVGLMFSIDINSITAFFAMAGKKRLVLLNPDDRGSTLLSQIHSTGVTDLVGQSDVGNYTPTECHDSAPDILFFTSGTTHEAKAVMLTESNLCSAAYNGGSMLALKRTDRLLSMLPYSHVFGLVCALLWPLSFGCTVCLGNGIRAMFTDFALYKPTATCLVPQMAKFLSMNRLFNRELSLVLIGAGVCDDATLSFISGMGIRVSYGYGLTETSSGIALSTGVNPRAMSICPDYEVSIAHDGEIVVKCSTTLMKGYYNDPKATAKVLKGNRFYTGDLGRIEKGLLYITGRKKEIMVFSDGSKIFLPEYEQRLSEALAPETDFAVIQGKGGEVVLAISGAKDVQSKVDAFNSGLPRSHNISRIVYMEHKLPRTRTGKVRRYDIEKSI